MNLDQIQSFYCKKLAQLVGWEVVEVAFGKDGFFGLVFQKENKTGCLKNIEKKILWIFRDDEANGPGSFSIENF